MVPSELQEPAAAQIDEPVGSETAPFLYVEDFWDASWSAGVAKFRLVRLRRSGHNGDYLEEVAVLAMSAKNLVHAHRFIGSIIEKMKESGDYVEEVP